jgi:hypothetical protein
LVKNIFLFFNHENLLENFVRKPEIEALSHGQKELSHHLGARRAPATRGRPQGGNLEIDSAALIIDLDIPISGKGKYSGLKA